MEKNTEVSSCSGPDAEGSPSGLISNPLFAEQPGLGRRGYLGTNLTCAYPSERKSTV